jgi:NADH-quinone oxidoreductase subunit H
MSAIFVTLFLGGPAGPAPIGPAWAWGLVWFFAKLMIFLFMFVWLRATLPRFRYDQLMDLGWKRLIPASLIMLMIVAGFQVTSNNKGWLAQREWGLVAIAGSVLLGLLLLRAIDVGKAATELEASQDARQPGSGGGL